MQYGMGAPTIVDDRVLVRIAALRDLARTNGEAFFVNFRQAAHGGSKVAIWLHPAVALRIVYERVEPVPISGAELSGLAETARVAGDVSV